MTLTEALILARDFLHLDKLPVGMPDRYHVASQMRRLANTALGAAMKWRKDGDMDSAIGAMDAARQMLQIAKVLETNECT